MKTRLHLWLATQSTAFRLAASYFVILLAICSVFSFYLYQLSVGQLQEQLRHQYARIYSGPIQLAPLFGSIKQPDIEGELDDGKRQLLANLAEFDLIVLALGSVFSYALAKRTVKPIEEALAAQKRFASDASHELRTPLTAMKTEIEVALRSRSLALPEAKSLLQSNLEEVDALERLTRHLLQLARTEANGVVMAPVSLQSVLTAARNRVESAAAAKPIQLELPKTELSVLGDKASLVEVVTILLDNAMKYSQPGQDVAVAASANQNDVSLTVTDHGIGIAEQDLPHIFERFFRADQSRTQTQTSGFGLGLAIAKNIVELHQGQLSAESEAGHGSTFTIRLPRAAERIT